MIGQQANFARGSGMALVQMNEGYMAALLQNSQVSQFSLPASSPDGSMPLTGSLFTYT
jgi:hypothetical protein